jgi:hypothetical protein
MDDGVVPGPRPSTLAAESEQDSSARELNPGPFGDFDDEEDSREGAESSSHHRSMVVLSDSSDDDEEFMVVLIQLAAGDAM